jgi:hypothetical protein
MNGLYPADAHVETGSPMKKEVVNLMDSESEEDDVELIEDDDGVIHL